MVGCKHKNNKNYGDIVNVYGLECLDCGCVRCFDKLIRRVDESERSLLANDEIRNNEDTWMNAEKTISLNEMIIKNTEQGLKDCSSTN